MLSATGKQRPRLSFHKTFVAFNNFLISGSNHNHWLGPCHTIAKPFPLSLPTPLPGRHEGIHCPSEGLAARAGKWEKDGSTKNRRWPKKGDDLLFLRIVNTWFFATLGKQRPVPPHCSPWPLVVLSPATSREPAEVSNWVWGFVEPMWLVADCNPHAKSQPTLPANLPFLRPWAGTWVGCLDV